MDTRPINFTYAAPTTEKRHGISLSSKDITIPQHLQEVQNVYKLHITRLSGNRIKRHNNQTASTSFLS